MKNFCKDCKYSLYVHPFAEEKGIFTIRCTKYYIKVLENKVSECFESFIGWHYREKNL